jgi:hypothetical protein
MVDRNIGGIYFNQHEVEEFSVEPNVSVESALETALEFGIVARGLHAQADNLIGDTTQGEQINKAAHLRVQAGKLSCFADAIKAKCTPDEIFEAELNRGIEAL